MKLKLNIDELNEDFFDDTRLLGIIAPIKSHQFCLPLCLHLLKARLHHHNSSKTTTPPSVSIHTYSLLSSSMQ